MMKNIPKSATDEDIEALFRGVSVALPDRETIEQTLRHPRKALRVKFGIDPTTPDLHFGYLVVFRRLRLLKRLGYQIVVLFGGFTARFGDPTEKSEARVLRPAEEVKTAMRNYRKQLEVFFGGRTRDERAVEFRNNAEWYEKMSAEELLRLMSGVTTAQMLERDMFRQRVKAEKAIGLHEPVYPLLQAYDSVMLESDLTIIGTDQVFNENVARSLQERHAQKPQGILGLELIPGTDGSLKMSQSLGNAILMTDSPKEQFGRLMSLPDAAALQYAKMLTEQELAPLEDSFSAGGVAARDAKLAIGETIIAELHGNTLATDVRKVFAAQFQKGEMPEEAPIRYTTETSRQIKHLLVDLGLASSNSEAQRLVAQGGVFVNGQRVNDPAKDYELKGSEGYLIRVGRRFVRVEYRQ